MVRDQLERLEKQALLEAPDHLEKLDNRACWDLEDRLDPLVQLVQVGPRDKEE